jgi:hypothetical protein
MLGKPHPVQDQIGKATAASRPRLAASPIGVSDAPWANVAGETASDGVFYGRCYANSGERTLQTCRLVAASAKSKEEALGGSQGSRHRLGQRGRLCVLPWMLRDTSCV